MNIALLLAGGIGSRLDASKPKQFVKVKGKPIIAYTMQEFQRHPLIDKIIIVCYEPYIPELEKIIKKYRISKYAAAVPGGKNGQESLFNGLKYLHNQKFGDEDLIIIHDAVRPFVPLAVLSDLIMVASKNGNACASLPCHETLVATSDQLCGNQSIERSTVRRVQTPQAYHLKELYETLLEAYRKGIDNSVYANTLMLELGHTIFFSKGFSDNIKITTKDDVALFKALLTLDEEDFV